MAIDLLLGSAQELRKWIYRNIVNLSVLKSARRLPWRNKGVIGLRISILMAQLSQGEELCDIGVDI